MAVALVAMLGVGLLAALYLVKNDANLTSVLRVGEYSASRPFVERSLSDVKLTNDYGHDGQQFYVLAATFPALEDAEPYVDDLQYRGRRVLYPALLSPLGEGPQLVGGMLLINLLAIGASAAALGVIAVRLGLSPWIGLAVVATPGLLDSVTGGLADALAFALALWGIAIWRRSYWLAVLLFTLAALTRETTLVAPMACVIVAPGWRRLVFLSPAVIWVGWAAAVSAWLPAGTSSSILDRFIVAPFSTWASTGWTSAPVMFVAMLVLLSALAAVELRTDLPEVALWLVADAFLLIIADPSILARQFNAARVVLLVVPAGVLALAHYRHRIRPRAQVEARGS